MVTGILERGVDSIYTCFKLWFPPFFKFPFGHQVFFPAVLTHCWVCGCTSSQNRLNFNPFKTCRGCLQTLTKTLQEVLPRSIAVQRIKDHWSTLNIWWGEIESQNNEFVEVLSRLSSPQSFQCLFLVKKKCLDRRIVVLTDTEYGHWRIIFRAVLFAKEILKTCS